MSIRYTSRARDDLIEIHDYIAEENPHPLQLHRRLCGWYSMQPDTKGARDLEHGGELWISGT
jgi:hypothetical protein